MSFENSVGVVTSNLENGDDDPNLLKTWEKVVRTISDPSVDKVERCYDILCEKFNQLFSNSTEGWLLNKLYKRIREYGGKWFTFKDINEIIFEINEFLDKFKWDDKSYDPIKDFCKALYDCVNEAFNIKELNLVSDTYGVMSDWQELWCILNGEDVVGKD